MPIATLREVSLLRELRHANVLALEAVHVEPGGAVSLVTDFVAHGAHSVNEADGGPCGASGPRASAAAAVR